MDGASAGAPIQRRILLQFIGAVAGTAALGAYLRGQSIAAASPAIAVFPAIAAQPSGVGAGAPIDVIRRTALVLLNNGGGRWFVSKSATGLVAAGVDDVLRVAVRGKASRDLEYYTQDRLFEITDLLAYGANVIDVSLIDRYGPNWGCSPIYFVNTDSGSPGGGESCGIAVSIQPPEVRIPEWKVLVKGVGRIELTTSFKITGTRCDSAQITIVGADPPSVELSSGSGRIIFDTKGHVTGESTWQPSINGPDWSRGITPPASPYLEFGYQETVDTPIARLTSQRSERYTLTIDPKPVLDFAKILMISLVGAAFLLFLNELLAAGAITLAVFSGMLLLVQQFDRANLQQA